MITPEMFQIPEVRLPETKDFFLEEFAQREADGRVRLVAKTLEPEKDGYDAVISGLPFHIVQDDPYGFWEAAQVALGNGTAFVDFSELEGEEEAIKNARISKNARLAMAYSEAMKVPVALFDRKFSASEESQARINNAIAGFGSSLPKDYVWLDVGNEGLPVTPKQLKALATAMAENSWSLFQRLQSAKKAVSEAKGLAEIEAVQF